MTANILDYGAVPGGEQLCTDAIQAAIDVCHAAGGGRVTVPAGRYLTGTLRLKSHVELHLEQAAVLKASSNLSDYNETDEYPQNADCAFEGWCGKHLILSVEQENVAITGNGKVEGAAESFFGGELHWFSNYCWAEGYYLVPEGKPLRPGQLITFVECRDIRVEGITIEKSTCWSLFFHGCTYVQARGLTIRNGHQDCNTDGIDIDSCSYVTVSDCRIDTGDDCLTLRASAARLSDPSMECKYVTITNCVCTCMACGIRIGVGVGCIHHVTVSNLVFAGTGDGLCFNTGYLGNGHAEMHDLTFTNIRGENVGHPINLYAHEAEIRRVTISDFFCDSKCNSTVGTDNGSLRDITLRNVELYNLPHTPARPEKAREEWGGTMLRVFGNRGLTLDGVRLYPDASYDRPTVAILQDNECLKTDISAVMPDGKIQPLL